MRTTPSWMIYVEVTANQGIHWLPVNMIRAYAILSVYLP